MARHDPHSYTDLTQARIRHIVFEVKVDFDARRLDVVAELLLASPSIGPLHLDSRNLDVKRAECATGPVAFEKGASDPILGECLCLHLPGGTDRVTIECRTAPEANALQWLEARHTAGGKHPFVFSQCQAIHARSLFPCQDSPSVRFTYEARVTVPAGLSVAMAAERAGAQQAGQKAVYSFRMPQPIPSYLFALAAGDLAFQEIGPRTGIYAEPSVLEAAAWEFGENEECLKAAERLLGPYQWDRYDLLVMPPSFPYGGMENPRLTFLTPLVILGDRSRTWLVTHELAHAWTGNLITNATWQDFWLNEGWTTYADSRITEALQGPDFARLGDLLNVRDLEEDLRAFGATSDRTCLHASMDGIDPDQAFSVVPYIKGFLFILSLERAVGRPAFDAFLRRYISTFGFQSITTEEFLSFLRRELPDAAASVDLDAWVYQPGLPESLPELPSRLVEDVSRKVAEFADGQTPRPGELQDWNPYQKGLYLKLLPETIAPEECRAVERALGMDKTQDSVLLYEFYRLAIRSGYKEVLPGMERFAATVGRQYYLARFFRCLAENEWSRSLARPLFERVRPGHHPVTASVVDHMLTQAGV
jgi:leukotriene-A4 hydrolase